MNQNIFQPADILLPKNVDLEKWAVIACDQFTSDQAYWDRVREKAGNAPSAIHLILPEAELGSPSEEESIASIHRTMDEYLNEELFTLYPNSYIYVERTLENGTIRKGLIGKLDLNAYNYLPGSTSLIRATEKTVLERIPPRQRVRTGAPIELPHILMLCDDHQKTLIEPVEAKKDQMQKLYDFDLMENGGRIRGWLVTAEDAAAFDQALSVYGAHYQEKYEGLSGIPMLFAVGDGNHSLATAKSCYEALKATYPDQDLSDHPARYALVELENIHDEAQVFEPIHRVVMESAPDKLLEALKDYCAPEGYEVKWFTKDRSGTVMLDPKRSELAVGVLQDFLDTWLKENPGKLDYIHDDEALLQLAAQDNAIGFLLPAMEKSQLFRGVIRDGALPRKTFSMGHSREKRYYLEGRKIL